MNPEKKIKLIFAVELIVIALIALVIGVLRLTNVIGNSERRLLIYNWITIFGGAWIVIDFVWLLFSEKRRKKNSLLDKCLNLPLGIALIVFDIICFANNSEPSDFTRIAVSVLLFYIAADYLFQGIYHYYKPLPVVLQAIEEAKKQPIEAEIITENPPEEQKQDKQKDEQ